jgi:hypothetical protein
MHIGVCMQIVLTETEATDNSDGREGDNRVIINDNAASKEKKIVLQR